jgi:hypothetical protein
MTHEQMTDATLSPRVVQSPRRVTVHFIVWYNYVINIRANEMLKFKYRKIEQELNDIFLRCKSEKDL